MTTDTTPGTPLNDAAPSLHNGIREAMVLGLSDVTITLDAAIAIRDALAASPATGEGLERLVDITGVDAIRRAVVTEMENEGVVTWGDPGHRARFLATTPDTELLDA